MTTKVTQDYGIRPDVDKDPADDSYQEFAQRPTWSHAMDVELQKHSELMRPWEHDDFPEMENYYPTPLGGWPDTILENMSKTIAFLPSVTGLCRISCFAPQYCDGYIECHAILHQCPPSISQLGCVAAQQWTVISTDPPGLVGNTEFNPALVRPFRIYPATTWPAWPNSTMAKITVQMSDAVGNVCRETITVFCREKDCCTSEDYVAMTLDTVNTDDTIDSSTPATVTVKDGCGPYNWSVSGTGYSINPNGESHSLSAVVSVVGGTCGVDYSPFCTVSITDECGTTVTKKIKNTAGQWVDTGDNICASALPCTTSENGCAVGYGLGNQNCCHNEFLYALAQCNTGPNATGSCTDYCPADVCSQDCPPYNGAETVYSGKQCCDATGRLYAVHGVYVDPATAYAALLAGSFPLCNDSGCPTTSEVVYDNDPAVYCHWRGCYNTTNCNPGCCPGQGTYEPNQCGDIFLYWSYRQYYDVYAWGC